MKKTEYVTFRTDLDTKTILNKLAAEKKWSISQMTVEIIHEWLEEKHPELMHPQEQATAPLPKSSGAVSFDVMVCPQTQVSKIFDF